MNLGSISKIIKLEREQDLQHILVENPMVLLAISEEWCSPCRAMEGTLMNTAFALEEKAVVMKAAVDTLPQLTAALNLRSIPAYIAYRQGEIVEVLYGIQPIQALTSPFL